MGCYHDSEPSIDEQYGLDVLSVSAVMPESEKDRRLHLLGEEEISRKRKNDVSSKIEGPDPQQQIFQLYKEYRPRLLRYMHTMHLKRDEAEEVIQETFLRLTTELLHGADIGNVQGWITRVSHNLAVDVLKRHERDLDRMTDIDAVPHETLVDPSVGPEETYGLKEKLERLQVALSTLNPQQLECFNLRIEGFRYKDIAKALHISEQRATIVVKQVAVRLAALCVWEDRR